MEKAHGRMLVTGAAGGVEVSASILPEPFPKALSRHPQGRKSTVCEPVRAPSLVSYKRNCNKPASCSCGRWSMRGEMENGTAKYVRLGCKAWTCLRCGPKKARRVRHGIIEQAQKLDLRRFLTLTLDPRKCTAEESIEHIRDAWRKFRVSLQRHLGRSVSFIAVVEMQKNGYAHLHVLIGHYVRQQWISAAWSAVGGGRMVDIRQVDIQRISAYVSKYMSKEMLLNHRAAKYRRYTTSRDIKLFEKAKSTVWKLIKMPISTLALLFGPRMMEENWAEDGVLEQFSTFSAPKPPPRPAIYAQMNLI